MRPSVPGNIRAGARNVTMELIASSMPGPEGGVDRPVLDQTGLTGMFDFAIEFTPQAQARQASGANSHTDSAGPKYLQAIREQLGLRLRSARGSVDVLVIDH